MRLAQRQVRRFVASDPSRVSEHRERPRRSENQPCHASHVWNEKARHQRPEKGRRRKVKKKFLTRCRFMSVPFDYLIKPSGSATIRSRIIMKPSVLRTKPIPQICLDWSNRLANFSEINRDEIHAPHILS